MTIAYDGLDLIAQGPLHPDQGPPLDTGPHSHLVAITITFQACSLQDPVLTSGSILLECFLVASVLALYTIHKAIGNFVDFQLLNAYFYRLPMKLWEGNVFTGVCHSVGGVPCDYYPLDLIVQGPTPSVQDPNPRSEQGPAPPC